MSRRVRALRGTLGLTVAVLLGVAGCGVGDPDPYAVLDQARTANYERIQVQLGFSLESAAQTDPDFPAPPTSVNVDPSWITAAAETTTGRFYLRLAVPLDALGIGNQGIPIGIPFQSIDLEALNDGTDLYVKSPLLPMALQGPFGGAGGAPVDVDLTGWVRLGSIEALAPLGGSMLFPIGLPGNVPALPGALPLPAAGDAAALKTFLTELGGTVEYAGKETVDGVELVHLKGGLNIVKLVQSQPFQNLTGMGRDQLQGIVEMEGNIGISTEIWVNKASGRLATFRVEIRTVTAPATTVAVILRIAEPGPEVTFEAPADFAEVDLAELIGNPFPGMDPTVGGGEIEEATAAPAMP